MKLSGEALRNGRTLGSKVLMSLFLSPKQKASYACRALSPAAGTLNLAPG